MWLCNYQNRPVKRVLVLVVLSWFASIGTTALRRPPEQQRYHNRPRFMTTTTITLTRMRGGANTIELNPDYTGHTRHPRGDYNYRRKYDEHEEWLRQNEQATTTTTAFAYQRTTNPPSIIEKVVDYFATLHVLSPSLFWTTTSCIGIFILWQLQAMAPHSYHRHSLLNRFFINSRVNCQKTFGLSLVLSAFSHISPYHLLVNLLSLSHLGPSVKNLLALFPKYSRPRLRLLHYDISLLTLWPLLLSSAIVSNGLYLLGSPRGASSLGLSGVTMSLLAIQARAYPHRHYGTMVMGVIPISLSAQQLLQLLLLISTLGSCSSSLARLFDRTNGNNAVAHLAHLGGLLYGLFYYEMVLLRSTPLKMLQKFLRFLQSYAQ